MPDWLLVEWLVFCLVCAVVVLAVRIRVGMKRVRKKYEK